MNISNLNKNDLKILYELDSNARKNYSEIAKKVGISKQAVQKRIENLIENKIISRFMTIVNIANFGVTPTQLFLTLNNTSEKKNKNL